MLKIFLDKSKNVAIVAVLSLFISCATQEGKVPSENNPEQISEVRNGTYTPKTLGKVIEKKEFELKDKTVPNKSQLRVDLVSFYASYHTLFPNDERTPDMLFKAGNESVNVEDYKSALTYYQVIVEDYPSFVKRPEAIYLQGFIYSAYTNQLGLAKTKFEYLIKKYPHHVFSEQAKLSVAQMGMSDEELIRQFEKQNK